MPPGGRARWIVAVMLPVYHDGRSWRCPLWRVAPPKVVVFFADVDRCDFTLRSCVHTSHQRVLFLLLSNYRCCTRHPFLAHMWMVVPHEQPAAGQHCRRRLVPEGRTPAEPRACTLLSVHATAASVASPAALFTGSQSPERICQPVVAAHHTTWVCGCPCVAPA